MSCVVLLLQFLCQISDIFGFFSVLKNKQDILAVAATEAEADMNPF